MYIVIIVIHCITVIHSTQYEYMESHCIHSNRVNRMKNILVILTTTNEVLECSFPITSEHERKYSQMKVSLDVRVCV
jgi:hypothetical protein